MVDVDRIIDELTSAKQQHPGQHSNLSEAEVRHLIVTVHRNGHCRGCTESSGCRREKSLHRNRRYCIYMPRLSL